MKRARWIICGASTAALIGFAVACSSSSSGGDDSSVANDGGGGGNDATVNDGSPGKDGSTDAGPDGAPFCNVSPCVVSLSTGGKDSCALLADGTVRCWGSNVFGELGFGTDSDSGVIPTDTATPTAATGLTGATSVSLGGFFDNEVLGHSCARVAGDGVKCWGINNYGQLGRGDGGPALDPLPAPALVSNVAQVAAGVIASCTLDKSGGVACWGYDAFSQVSAGATTAGAIYAAPTPLALPTGLTFTQIATGVANVCGISADKHVWCWGLPQYGNLGRAATDGGLADSVPGQVPGISDAVQIAGGYVSECVLTSDGVAHCWGGLGGPAVLGRGDVDAGPFDYNEAPVVMPAGVTFKQIEGHLLGFCALDTTGSVWCWGANQNGADGPADGGGLDSGTPPAVSIPTKIPIDNVDQISSSNGGGGHVCALVHGGSVKCWGYNSNGQLGVAPVDGGATFSTTPVAVTF